MEDKEIIALYFKRKPEAIKETSDKYEHKLRYQAERILNSKEDAEECVNDTLLKAWNSIPPNKPQYLFAYLAKICRNVALNREYNRYLIRGWKTVRNCAAILYCNIGRKDFKCRHRRQLECVRCNEDAGST